MNWVLIAILLAASPSYAFGKHPTTPSPPPDEGLPDAPETASNSGPQDVAVILLDYPGDPYAGNPNYPVTKETFRPDPSFLKEIFTGTLGDVSISDFFGKASENRAPFRNVEVFGPYSLDQVIYCGDEEKLWPLGVQAASNDVNFQKFSRIVFVMPRPMVDSRCDIWGAIAAARAEMTCIDTDTGEGNRCLNFAWMGWQEQMRGLTAGDLSSLENMRKNGYSAAAIEEARQHSLILSKYYITKMISHELLHGFGLMHNNIYADTFNEVIPPVGTEVPRLEYGDGLPVMSSGGTGNPVGWLTGAHLVRLGWLNDDEWRDIQTDQTVDLMPLGYGQSGVKVLRISRNGSDDYLWLEYRELLNSYDHVSFWPVGDWTKRRIGVVVHETSSKLTDGETVLLKFNAGTPDGANNPDFRMPNLWKDPYSPVQIEILSQTPEKAQIRVSFH